MPRCSYRNAETPAEHYDGWSTTRLGSMARGAAGAWPAVTWSARTASGSRSSGSAGSCCARSSRPGAIALELEQMASVDRRR